MATLSDGEYKEELRIFQKDINFILDDILNAYYPGGKEELDLHKDIAEKYDLASAKRLYELISAKTPYRRVWDIFVLFHDLLFDFIEIINKIKAMDRIHERRQTNLNKDLRDSFDDEYTIEIENCVDVADNISKLDIFFEYFVLNNDRVLVKIFDQNNLKKLYIWVNNILHCWKQNENIIIKDKTGRYMQTLNQIRNVNVSDLHQIVMSWKYLKKRLKHYYPTSKIWYSKKYYFNLLHELIDVLEKYHKFKETSDIQLLYPIEKKNRRLNLISKHSFLLRRRSFARI